MDDKIFSLSKGNVSRENFTLVTDVDYIKSVLILGSDYKGTFNISTNPAGVLRGKVCSDNPRVEITNNYIEGKNIEVSFNIKTFDLVKESILVGNFYIVTNCGEARIPYEYTFKEKEKVFLEVNFQTKEEFVNYCANDFTKGFDVFVSPTFIEHEFMKNEINRAIYQGLIISIDKQVAYKEFLSFLNPSIFPIDETQYQYQNEETKTEDTKVKEFFVDILEDAELIENLATYLVMNEAHDEFAFYIYQKGISLGANTGKIYEYFLLSLPKDYKYMFPKEVYSYFLMSDTLSYERKIPLYDNILRNFASDTETYNSYIPQIIDCTRYLISKEIIRDDTAFIYDKTITKEIIDKNTAQKIPFILRSYRISQLPSNIVKVILKYTELENESSYDVDSFGVAYVPIFFDSFMLFFEDSGGNRHINIPNVKSRIYDKEDLEEMCFKIFPDQAVLKLARLKTIEQRNYVENQIEENFATSLIATLDINPILKERLENMLLKFRMSILLSDKLKDSEDLTESLGFVDFGILSQVEQEKIIELLCERKEFDLCYNYISKYTDGIMPNNLFKDFLNHALENIDKYDKKMILYLCFNAYRRDIKDPAIINYLCENLDATSYDLYSIFSAAKGLSCILYDLPKRLLEQMLFSNTTEGLDEVFEAYMMNTEDEDLPILEDAYLTVKTYKYFVNNQKTDVKIFEKLEKLIFDNLERLNSIPKIYLVAFSKYISEQISVEPNQRRIMISLSKYLIDSRLVFSFSKKLNKYVDIPEYILNSECIEYYAKENESPRLFISYNNSSDGFREINFRNTFENIYTREIIVFRDDVIDYKICNANSKDMEVLKSGQIVYDMEDKENILYRKDRKDTYDYINDCIEAVDNQDFKMLKQLIRELIRRKEMVKLIFE